MWLEGSSSTGGDSMSKTKEERKRLRKKVRDQGAGSRNKRKGGSYTRPLLLEDFQPKKEGAD